MIGIGVIETEIATAATAIGTGTEIVTVIDGTIAATVTVTVAVTGR